MKVLHLVCWVFLLTATILTIYQNPTDAEASASKKKSDNTRTTDFGYEAELKIVQEKLRCAQHAGPNRWCYVSPTHPNEHVALLFEEITLWARKIVSIL